MKRFIRHWLATAISVIFLAVSCYTMAGCSSTQIEDLKVQLSHQQDVLDQVKEDAEKAKTDAANKGDEDALAAANKKLAEVAASQKAIDEALLRLQTATKPDGSIDVGSAAAAAGAALPPPWNVLAIVGGIIVTGLAQEARVQREARAAKSITDGITAMQMNDPAASPMLKRNADAINGELTPRAKQIISKNKIKVRTATPVKTL